MKLEGVAIKFNSWSQPLGGFKERLLPGSLDDSLRSNADVFALLEHDRTKLLGRTASGTLRLRTDQVGAHFDLDLSDTTLSRDVHENVAVGNYRSMSFAFSMPADGEGEDWDPAPDGSLLRTISKVGRIWEISVVSDPAYIETSVSARSLEDGEDEDITIGQLAARRAARARYVADPGAVEREILRARLGLLLEERSMNDSGVVERAALTVDGAPVLRSATLARGELAVGRKILRDAQRAHRLGRTPREMSEAEARMVNLALNADEADLRRRKAELSR